MAISSTTRLAVQRATGGTFTTASFTPANDSLLVLTLIGRTTSRPTLTVTGGSLSWTRIATVNNTTTTAFIEIWTAQVSTAASMTVTVTVNSGSYTSMTYTVVDVTGHDRSNPVRQTRTNSGASGAFSLSFSPTTLSTSYVLTALGSYQNPFEYPSPGSGWTNIASGSGFVGTSDHVSTIQSIVGAVSAGAWTGITSAIDSWATAGVEIREATPPRGVLFRSASNTTYASRTNTTVTAPANIQNDDILLAQFIIGNGSSLPAPSAPTAPAGWNLITDTTVSGDGGTFNSRVLWYWKRASSESGDYTWTHGSFTTQAAIIVYSGCVKTGTPYNASQSFSTNSSSSLNTFSSITTTAANSMLVGMAIDWGDTTNNLTAPSGYTERLDVAPLFYFCEKLQAVAGSSGAATMTNNSASGEPSASMHLALTPATGLTKSRMANARVIDPGGVPLLGFTTPSFIPESNSLLVFIVGGQFAENATAIISDTAGLTWTLRQQATVDADGAHFYIWTAQVVDSIAMTITVNTVFTTAYSWAYEVLNYNGHKASNPIGATAFSENSLASGGATWSWDPTLTLSADPAGEVLTSCYIIHNGGTITLASNPSNSGWDTIQAADNVNQTSYDYMFGVYFDSTPSGTDVPWGQFSGTTAWNWAGVVSAIEINIDGSSGTLNVSESADTPSQYVRTNGKLIINFLGQVANSSTLGNLTNIGISPSVLISPGSLIVAIVSVYPYNANEPITLTSSASTLISFKLLSKNTSVGSMTTCIFYAVVPFTDAVAVSTYTLNIPNECIFAGLQLFEFKRQNLVFPFLSRDVVTNNSGDLLLTSWTPTVIANHSTKSERFVTVSGFIDSGGDPGGAKLSVNAQTDQDNPGALRTIIFNSLSDNTLSFFMSTHTEWGTSQTTAGWDFVYDTVNFSIAADHLTAAYFEVQENTAKGGL